MNRKYRKQMILDFLEGAYNNAKEMDDVELMCRLSRAIIAFSYNDFSNNDWSKMLESYLNEE